MWSTRSNNLVCFCRKMKLTAVRVYSQFFGAQVPGDWFETPVNSLCQCPIISFRPHIIKTQSEKVRPFASLPTEFFIIRREKVSFIADGCLHCHQVFLFPQRHILETPDQLGARSTRPEVISNKEVLKSFYKSQLPRTSVIFFLPITHIGKK